jgi:hypothetical protein
MLDKFSTYLLGTIDQVWASIIDENFGRFERIDRLLDYVKRKWIANGDHSSVEKYGLILVI